MNDTTPSAPVSSNGQTPPPQPADSSTAAIDLVALLTDLNNRLARLDSPPPPAPRKGVLPINSRDARGATLFVKRGQTARVTARPQSVAFRPTRVIISSYTAPAPAGLISRYLLVVFRWIAIWFRMRRLIAAHGNQPITGADYWEIEDITIGNRSQYAQSGKLPGGMFASGTTDSFVSFDTAQTAMDIVLVVRYIGPHDSAQFVGAIIGDVA